MFTKVQDQRPTTSRPTRLGLIALGMLMMLSPVASRQLATVRLAEGGDLQAAIDAAKPGDVIVLAPGARFTGSFVLPARPDATAFITIRTEGPGVPAAGTRVSPRHAGALAVIQSRTSDPALSTAPGAHHWRIEAIEFGPNKDGDGNIIALGNGDERTREAIPHDLVLDRVYVHGDRWSGQKRGIALNSASTEIRNSYIGDIKGVGVDTQAIAGWNGPGPFTIENNYLEAAGENVMFGGADPVIAELVPSGIVFRRNEVTRPVAWREPVLATPANVTGTTTRDGMLAAGTYAYRVVAERRVAGGAQAVSEASTPVSVTLATTGTAALRWQAIDGATAYRVFRSGGDGGTTMWRVTEPRFADTGAAGQTGTVPKPSYWSVKNLFELKNAADVTIDGNLFEHHWAGGQSGYAIVFTPRNQGGKAPWSRVEQVRFTNNVVRHVSAAFNILGEDNLHPSGKARAITIENNLFVDVSGSRWGGPGDFLQLGNGAAQVHVARNTVQQSGRMVSVYGKAPATGFVFRGNLIRHNAYGVMGDNASPGKSTFERYLPEAVFEDNVIAGGDRSRYPGNNRFLAPDALDAELTGRTADDGAGADLGAITAAVGSLVDIRAERGL